MLWYSMVYHSMVVCYSVVWYCMVRYGMVWVLTIPYPVLHADRVTHADRYMRLTKGDKVKHMFVSLGALHFGDLFTL